MYCKFYKKKVLTDGKLVLGKSKGWFNSSLIEFPYKHPSTKQCNYSIDTSNFVTKTELEKVKGMIDVSAKLVGTLHGSLSRQKVKDTTYSKSHSFDFDYVVIKTPAIRVSDTFIIAPDEVIIKKGSTGGVLIVGSFPPSGSGSYTTSAEYASVEASGTSITFSLASTSAYYTICFNAYFYKYDS